MSEKLPQEQNMDTGGFQSPKPVWDLDYPEEDVESKSNRALLRHDEPETYVEDKEKAEIMAYATKPIEESILHDREEVVNLLSTAGDYPHALPMAKQRTEEIKNKREFTDNLAQQVADTYDEVHKY